MKSIENMTREELIKAYVTREKELCAKIESKYIKEQKLAEEKKRLNEENNKLNKKVEALMSEVTERKQELVEKMNTSNCLKMRDIHLSVIILLNSIMDQLFFL